MNTKRIKVLKQLLSEIEDNIPNKELSNSSVSKATIGWQLDHSLKVFNVVCEWTMNSNPKDYERKFNFWRTVLFPINYIPRGKVKAPKIVKPPEIILTEDLHTQLNKAKSNLDALLKFPKTVYFKHFVFGKLSKKQTLKFLQMHTNHHLKIVREILKK